jgi:hypothetical protein
VTGHLARVQWSPHLRCPLRKRPWLSRAQKDKSRNACPTHDGREGGKCSVCVEVTTHCYGRIRICQWVPLWTCEFGRDQAEQQVWLLLPMWPSLSLSLTGPRASEAGADTHRAHWWWWVDLAMGTGDKDLAYQFLNSTPWLASIPGLRDLGRPGAVLVSGCGSQSTILSSKIFLTGQWHIPVIPATQEAEVGGSALGLAPSKKQ